MSVVRLILCLTVNQRRKQQLHVQVSVHIVYILPTVECEGTYTPDRLEAL